MTNEVERVQTEELVYQNETGEMLTDSRIVAANFGKQHRDVLKAIRNLECSEDFSMRNFAQTPYVEPQNGQTYNMYTMTRDGFAFLAMGFTGAEAAKWKESFIGAFNSLERAALTAPKLVDPAALRGLLLDYTEKVIELEGELAEAKPKIEALERIAEADGSLCVTDAAKALQLRPKDLFSYLSQHGWLYKRAGSAHWLGYQARVLSGLLEHKVTTVLRPDGSERITEQVRVTPKGLSKLAMLIKPVAV